MDEERSAIVVMEDGRREGEGKASSVGGGGNG